MSDLIDRQAAIEALGEQPLAWEQGEYEDGLIAQWESDVEAIKNLPPAQPEQRTGRWIPADSQCGIRCSICGVPVDDFCHSIDYIDLDYEPNFCPNCGLPMKGANNEND